MLQLQMFSDAPPAPIIAPLCSSHAGFYSLAYVPGGLFCTHCNMIVMRDMPPPENEPELIGYISATWAWKYRDGNDWTDDSEI